jgi:hypothetical protein
VHPIRNPWHHAAAAGTAFWAGTMFALRPDFPAGLVLLAAFVVVPLGLALVHLPARPLLAVWQVVAALLLVLAFTLPAGWLAFAVAVPWWGLCGTLAALGVARLWQPSHRSLAGLSASVSLVFLAVGASWLALSRLGVGPGEPGACLYDHCGLTALNFGEPITLLTAAHFHYAGFALTLVVALLAREWPGRLSTVMTAGVLVGVPLVATAITLDRRLEWPAGWWMATAAGLVALRLVALGLARPVLWPLVPAGVCLLVGMGLAAGYAWQRAWGGSWLDIPTMAAWHGTLNAAGFALPTLWAWNRAASQPDGAGPL